MLEYAAYLTTARHLGPTEHAIAVLGGMMGLRATEMATLTVESFGTVRGYATLLVVGKGDKPARVPVPIPPSGPFRPPSMAAPAGRCCAPAPVPAWTGGACTATSPRPPGRRASPGPSATYAAPHRRSQSGHPVTRRPATPPPRPPGDHPGQLRHHRRSAGTPRLPPDRRIPRRMGRLIGVLERPTMRQAPQRG